MRWYNLYTIYWIPCSDPVQPLITHPLLLYPILSLICPAVRPLQTSPWRLTISQVFVSDSIRIFSDVRGIGYEPSLAFALVPFLITCIPVVSVLTPIQIDSTLTWHLYASLASPIDRFVDRSSNRSLLLFVTSPLTWLPFICPFFCCNL